MISEKIVRLHNIDIWYLGRLQDFARAFRASDVGACADLTPFSKRARDTYLRPNPDDQRDADI